MKEINQQILSYLRAPQKHQIQIWANDYKT